MSSATAPGKAGTPAILMNILAIPAFVAALGGVAWLGYSLFPVIIEAMRFPNVSTEEQAALYSSLTQAGVALAALAATFAVYIVIRGLRLKVGGNSSAGLISRLDGLLADFSLLSIFLLFGVSALNILVAVVVVVVGLFRSASLPTNAVNLEQGRLAQDLLSLGVAVVVALVVTGGWWLYLKLRKKLLHRQVDSGFEAFVSKRYLLAREGGRLVLLISTVSILGVAVGVMALIVVQGVMAGAEQSLKSKFMGIYAHIEFKVDPRSGIDPEIPRPVFERMIDDLNDIDYIDGAGPVMTYDSIIQAESSSGEEKFGVLLRGVDPDLEKDVTSFFDYTIEGSGMPERRQIVIGKVLARRLNIGVGDRVYAVGKIVATANRTRPRTLPLEVVGIFDSGIFEVDERFVIASLKTVQDLTVSGDVATSVQVTIDDPDRTSELGMELLDMMPPGIGFITWQDRNRPFFQALQIERISMFIILNLIVLVAALNIIGTLVMTVVQKTRDIGILKSMGAPSGSILRIFLLHGFLIGMIGTSLGTVWGLRLCLFVRQDIEKIFKIPEGVYGLDQLPVLIDSWEIAIMVAVAMIICIAASIIPAWQAARLHPVEALRYD